MSTGILVVSFGTTFDDTREKNIGAVCHDIQEEFAPMPVYQAFTSGMVRASLARRGITIPPVDEALKQMHKDGITRVAILPTHLLYGEEFDKLCAQAQGCRTLFEEIKIAKPLLAGDKDFIAVLTTLAQALPTQTGEALVLMGHGTAHFCNTVYGALDCRAKALGLDHLFVGTVEAWPDLDAVIAALKKGGFTGALVTPLMLVAGDHATNDMASHEKDSWKTRLIQNGFACRTVVRGLGEYPAVRKLYCSHLAEVSP